jgi:hypothetical protein
MPTTLPEGTAALHFVSDDWDGTLVGLGTATWTPVDGLSRYQRSGQANTTSNAIYGRAQAVTTIGQPDRTITLNGFYADGDAGQEMLRAYSPDGANANEDLGYAYLRDGTKGFAVMVKVGGGDEGSAAEGGLQDTSFTLAPQADPVVVTNEIPGA